ncbi:MAG: hypothetical protein CFE34_00965 [Rhodobacteraceae bacterium PARR1]|nr:MAG: hypothetical protein CFE34_00965 [Rhodobacteraceae bacterium PARR1]
MADRRALFLTAPGWIWLTVFFLLPCGVLFAYAFGTTSYTAVNFGTSLKNFGDVLTTPTLQTVVLRSLTTGLAVATLTVLLAFPLAYAITLGPFARHATPILLLVVVSLFSAFIVRIYAWRTILGSSGVVNTFLMQIGLTTEPLDELLYSRFAVVLTLTSVLIPVAVLPLTAALSGVPRSLIEAARNMGTTAPQAFRRVTLPLASGGIGSAFALTFVVGAGDFITPQLVGGPSSQMAGSAISSRFGISFDWPQGAAIAFTLVAGMVAVLVALRLLMRAAGMRDRP